MSFTSDQMPSEASVRQLDAQGNTVPGSDPVADALQKAFGDALAAVGGELAKRGAPPPPPPPQQGLFGMKPGDVVLAGALLAVGAIVVVVVIATVRGK